MVQAQVCPRREAVEGTRLRLRAVRVGESSGDVGKVALEVLDERPHEGWRDAVPWREVLKTPADVARRD